MKALHTTRRTCARSTDEIHWIGIGKVSQIGSDPFGERARVFRLRSCARKDVLRCLSLAVPFLVGVIDLIEGKHDRFVSGTSVDYACPFERLYQSVSYGRCR